MSWTTYIYYDRETNTVTSSTSASASVGENKILLCVASPVSWSGKKAEFQAFWTNDQSTFIYASNIAANTITWNEIAANTITAAEIDAGAITTAKIDAWAVTASKITVWQLSDIDSDLWSIIAGNITWTTITAGSTSSGAWIKLYPNSSTDGRMDFYYNGSVVGRMVWWNYSWVWNAVLIYWWTWGGTIWLLWTTICVGKLKIPVWNNLYD
jgi:hypothetical protein